MISHDIPLENGDLFVASHLHRARCTDPIALVRDMCNMCMPAPNAHMGSSAAPT